MDVANLMSPIGKWTIVLKPQLWNCQLCLLKLTSFKQGVSRRALLPFLV